MCTVFVSTPYDPTKPAVEGVLDSSRYFVIRVEDVSTGKKAYLGLGFIERSDSFDFSKPNTLFRHCIQPLITCIHRCGTSRLHKVQSARYLVRFVANNAYLYRRWKAALNPPSPTASDKPSPHMPAGPKKDYSLKDGQTFSISIPGRAKQAPSGGLDLFGAGGSSSTGGGGGIPLLPPPPKR